MALRLDDLKSKNKITSAVKVMEFSDSDYERHVDTETLDEKTNSQLRPWQGLESVEFETRTYAANEAVQRAREKAKKNERQAMELREGFVSDQMINHLKQQQEQRDKFFNFHDRESSLEESKIRTSSVFVKFFRDLVRQ
jgi:hypothetical protein